MTKKERELIEILLDNITPDNWPVEAKFAAQDKKSLTWGKNKLMFYKQGEPPFVKTGATVFSGNVSGDKIALPELCKHWSKTIVTRDEFVKRWNERIHSDDKESHADHGAKLLACDDVHMASEPVRKSPLSTQVGGNHYTKLAIQPMRYSMENGLDPLQHTIIKYVTRFRDKAGIEDLEKAKHCIDMLIEFEKESK